MAQPTVMSSVGYSTPEGARALLVEANRQFVANPAMRAQFGVLLTDIADTDGPQIIHCQGGRARSC